MNNIVLNSERFGEQVIFLEECESTNDLALSYARSGTVKKSVLFVTEKQTKGRGQRGSVWVAEPGANLTFSLLWYPEKWEVKHQFVLNQMASLAVAKTLVDLGVQQVKVKWPNDVYVGADKISGILIENMVKGKYITASVIGIGLNINQPAIVGVNMVSLSELIAVKLSRAAILKKIVKNLDGFLDRIKQGFDLHAFYLENLYGFNQVADFKNLVSDAIFTGKICGVGVAGHLEIEVDDEVRKFEIKEVAFL